MFTIASNGIVTVNRGDSFLLPVSLNVGNSIDYKPYILRPEDKVYLGVMEPNQPFETALIRKVFTYADYKDSYTVLFRFWPEDTECVLPGKYYYQVKIQTFDEESQKLDTETVVDKTLFYIQE